MDAVLTYSPLALDLRAGLTGVDQMRLSPRWLYDDVGSALFEAITQLDEYGLTRAEERLLRQHTREIVEACHAPLLVVELGSGSGRKTRRLLEALQSRQNRIRYCPIDVSATSLAACEKELADLADVLPVQGEYLEGLQEALSKRSGEKVLLLFLGSTIGNFERPAAESFLRSVRQLLSTGDSLLIGADLEKAVDRMLLAYDDHAGVTAAFNRNVLARMNRELEADFDVRSFEHHVRYDAREQRIEMHLRATRRQRVRVPPADLTIDIAAGETIWTESSHKFRLRDLEALALRSSFHQRHCWVDKEWPFAECLWTVP